MAKGELDSNERAGVFLLSIGQERAAEILRHMDPKEVQVIGFIMAGLSNISADTVDSVLEGFVNTIQDQTALGVDSNDYIRNMLNNALGPDKAATVIDKVLRGYDNKGIEQMKWMDPNVIANLLKQEHPQIIATLLSLLDSDQAAAILSFFPESMRADILMRVATLEGVQPAAIKQLDIVMEKQLSGNVKSSDIGGIEIAANILNFIDVSVETDIMEKINDSNAELAQEIQDKLFVFGDLAAIDDRAIQSLLREIATDSLLLALRGAENELKEKIFNNMSNRAADLLRDDLEAAAPAKLSDVEAAQKEILAVARRLEEAGEINLGGSGDELV